MLRDSRLGYGWITKILHWLLAVAVIALFALGVWMVELSYYDSWYRYGPDLHKPVGVIVGGLMLLRLLWRLLNPKPQSIAEHKAWECSLAKLTHLLLYLLIFTVILSGYLISTADGRGIDMFGWFQFPSAGQLFANQADRAGRVHQWIAYLLILLVMVHAVGALKHHFIDKDNTLKRMLGE